MLIIIYVSEKKIIVCQRIIANHLRKYLQLLFKKVMIGVWRDSSQVVKWVRPKKYLIMEIGMWLIIFINILILQVMENN